MREMTAESIVRTMLSAVASVHATSLLGVSHGITNGPHGAPRSTGFGDKEADDNGERTSYEMQDIVGGVDVDDAE